MQCHFNPVSENIILISKVKINIRHFAEKLNLGNQITFDGFQ